VSRGKPLKAPGQSHGQLGAPAGNRAQRRAAARAANRVRQPEVTVSGHMWDRDGWCVFHEQECPRPSQQLEETK